MSDPARSRKELHLSALPSLNGQGAAGRQAASIYPPSFLTHRTGQFVGRNRHVEPRLQPYIKHTGVRILPGVAIYERGAFGCYAGIDYTSARAPPVVFRSRGLFLRPIEIYLDQSKSILKYEVQPTQAFGTWFFGKRWNASF